MKIESLSDRDDDSFNPLTLNDYIYNAYQTSLKHGFWNSMDCSNVTVILSKLMLIVTEVAEAAEAVRKPNNKHDETLRCFGGDSCEDWHFAPDYAHVAEELADICIRVFDLAGATGCDLQTALQQKMAYNETRPYMHNKKA